jgi:hypothetical protein
MKDSQRGVLENVDVSYREPPREFAVHRFGVSIKTAEETKRDRRIGPDEEKALLDAALTMNSPEHSMGRIVDARPDHWRARDVLPSGRNASYTESAHRAATNCRSFVSRLICPS